MPDRSQAEEHLRAIRSLMEKATIYRAISAPAAIVGGTLTLANSALLLTFHQGNIHSVLFPLSWLGVLVLTVASGLWLLRRDAQRRGETFLSAGMRSALWAMIPPTLCAAWITGAMYISEGFVEYAISYWMLFYGLALLATAHFAPRSIALLGWAFLAAGLVSLTAGSHFTALTYLETATRSATILMALTFGLFHLIYAACTWPRKKQAQTDSGAMP